MVGPLNPGDQYPNPPLVEAVCEFRFEAGNAWNAALPGLIYTKLRDAYPSIQSALVLESSSTFLDGAPAHRVSPADRVRAVSEDERSFVQIGVNVVSIHVLRPYPGWQAFRTKIQSALEAFAEVVRPRQFARVGLRYVNHIEVPSHALNLEDSFDFYPHLGRQLPKAHQDFLCMVEFSFNQGRDLARMQLVRTKAEESNTQRVILDIDYWLQVADSISLAASESWLDAAHEAVEKLFEGSITTQLRQQFGEH